MYLIGLLEQIKNGEIVLPDIQRDFIWDEMRIEKLFDSIMRDYPIGIVLLWETYNDIQYREFIKDCRPDMRHSFYENNEQKRLKLVLDGQQRLQSLYLSVYGSKDPLNNKEYKSIRDEAERVMGKVSGKTLDFKNCILIFMKDIVDANYFSRISKKKYDVANKETQEIYGKTIDTSDALWKIKLLRDNYAHIPDPMYEERGLLPYLYDFLVYIAKKEFPEDFA